MIGIWPLIMGVTMFVQMKLNPTPPDPMQAMIFTWMPVIFTFMLASLPGRAGDLLGVEQLAVDHPAGGDHARARASNSAARESRLQEQGEDTERRPVETDREVEAAAKIAEPKRNVEDERRQRAESSLAPPIPSSGNTERPPSGKQSRWLLAPVKRR